MLHAAVEAGMELDVLHAVAERSMAQISAENFPVAMRVLPAAARTALRAVYAFARFVDDVGDEAPGDRLALLDTVAAEVDAQWAGRPSALAPVAGLQQLPAMPQQPFLDLIEANRIDQRRTSYADFADLIGYCQLSAAPIGRIVLRLADADTPRNVADSDAICNALQVLEHCQDVGEDARAGRVYLPQDDLAEAGVSAEQLPGLVTPPPLRHVVAAQVARSVEMLHGGAGLVGRLSGWPRVAVAGYLGGGLATADALRAADYDVLSRTIKPGKLRTGLHALRQLARR